MKNLNSVVAAINSDGCTELPFVQDATQTYFNYLNGVSGYLVFIVGGALLVLSMVSRKQLGKTPGWLAGIVIVALALGALPVMLDAFGIGLGCGNGEPTTQEAPGLVTPPAANGGQP